MAAAELDHNLPDLYRQSVEQLLGLLGAADDQAAAQHYYTVAWDQAMPNRIADVAVMTAAPTGARRQERFGQFYSAQFCVTETNSAGQTAERFLWCDTGPQWPGTAIEPDAEALAVTHNYDPLTPESVVGQLASKAVSIDDYLTLTSTLLERGVEPTRGLINDVNSLVYRFVHSGFGNRSGAYSPHDQDKVFELITSFQAFGSELPQAVVGYLISQILRTISAAAIVRTAGNREAADRAANLLQSAIAQGVIPENDERLMGRVLGSRAIYAYPFATEMVHARLHDGNRHGTPRYIFGVKRVAYISDFITTTLGARDLEVDPYIESLIRSSYLSGYEEGSARHLYNVLNGLLGQVDRSRMQSAATSVNNLSEVAHGFATVLAARRIAQRRLTDEQVALDAKAVDIVRTVVQPLIDMQVGRRATAPEVEIEAASPEAED